MKIASQLRVTSLLAALLLLTAFVFGTPMTLRAAEKIQYQAVGTFVEGCNCGIPCSCPMTGPMHGCQGVGAMLFTSGAYKGTDLAGAKLAYATSPGAWIRFYLQTKNAKQQEAVTELAKAIYKDFGKVESVKTASIDLTGKNGKYMLSVDGGKIMQLDTEPVLGADNKTPITHTNVREPLSGTVMQAKTVKGTFRDGDRSFTLGNSNAYFNPGARSSGM